MIDTVEIENEAPSTRGRFLRKLAALAAVGVGAGAFAGTARAEPTRCCKNSSQCPAGHPCSGVGWWCIGGCGGCCVCLTGADCQSFNCPCP